MNSKRERLQRPPLQNLQRQRGLTIVELMVSMTIGLFLMGAVGIIYVNTTTTSRASTLESQMNEDATLALELLQQQIRLAGYSGVDAEGKRLFSGIGVKGCDGGLELADQSGSKTAAFGSLTCLPPQPASGLTADSLAVRYEATALNSQATSTGDPGNCSHQGIAAWNATSDGGTASVRLADNRYFIANEVFSTTVNGSTVQTNVPSLFCRGRTGGGFSNATALIPNIEDMQIQYGVTATPKDDEPFPNQVTAYLNANNTILGSAPENLGNWARVVSVRICLLARTANPIPLGDNAVGKAGQGATPAESGLGTYTDCNGTKVTKDDRYLRRAYVTTIQLRNTRPALPATYSAGKDPWRDTSLDEQ